jgi:hypothetical protein
MEENQILQQVADTITEQSVKFIIKKNNAPLLERILIVLKIKKPFNEFELRPITMGKMIQISKLLLSIPTDDLKLSNDLDRFHKLVCDHGDTICNMIAIAVHPGKHVPASLPQLIKDNLNAVDAQRLSYLILSKINVSAFIATIVTLKGVQILQSETRPKDKVPGSTFKE